MNIFKITTSTAFLISSVKGDDLQFFTPETDHVGYFEKLEDVKGDCGEYVRTFSSYHEKTVRDLVSS